MTRPVIVAIDGPAGAGKSTVARTLAARLGFTLVDTGAIYRAVALTALRSGVAFDDAEGLAPIVASLELRFELQGDRNHAFLAGEDVSEAIRTPEVSMGASTCSAVPVVRAGLLELQRRLATETDRAGAVLEGRDIGTVVFPDADFKFFLTASPEERARRRYDELVAKGQDVVFETILAEQIARDAQDSGRAVAPLKPAEDAVHVDSSGIDAAGVVDLMVARIRG